MSDELRIATIDQYLQNEAKVLDGFQPHWTYHPGYKDHQISWQILEEDSGLIRSRLQLRMPEQNSQFCSISLLYQGNAVCRIDLDSTDVCKQNPVWAARQNLPPLVCGPHIHTWGDNKGYILDNGVWDIPARRGINQKIDGIEDMFFWFCEHINVRIQRHNTPLLLPDVGLWGQRC